MSTPLISLLFGPTASGKTAWALEWAQRTKGNLLSADSRQIYTDMKIVVGKDIPAGSTWQSETEIADHPAWLLPSGALMWGTDVVPPTHVFSLSHWFDWAAPIIAWHLATDTPLLIVGGTWQWQSVLFDPPASLFVPPDAVWRTAAQAMTLPELQTALQEESSRAWEQLNASDRANPYRLIRAVEVQRQTLEKKPVPLFDLTAGALHLRQPSLDQISGPIWNRVLERWENGALEETQALLEKYPDWDTPAFSATGYASIRQYLEKKINQEEALRQWFHTERQYAKRQITWCRSIAKQYPVTEV